MGDATLVGILVAVATGTAIALQAPLNNLLTQHIGLIETAFVVLLIGAAVCGILLLVSGRSGLGNLPQAPPVSFAGGLLGVVILTGIVVTVSQLGVTVGLAAILVAQFLALIVIEHFGLLGVERQPITTWAVTGIVLLVLGAVLIRR